MVASSLKFKKREDGRYMKSWTQMGGEGGEL